MQKQQVAGAGLFGGNSLPGLAAQLQHQLLGLVRGAGERGRRCLACRRPFVFCFYFLVWCFGTGRACWPCVPVACLSLHPNPARPPTSPRVQAMGSNGRASMSASSIGNSPELSADLPSMLSPLDGFSDSRYRGAGCVQAVCRLCMCRLPAHSRPAAGGRAEQTRNPSQSVSLAGCSSARAVQLQRQPGPSSSAPLMPTRFGGRPLLRTALPCRTLRRLLRCPPICASPIAPPPPPPPHPLQQQRRPARRGGPAPAGGPGGSRRARRRRLHLHQRHARGCRQAVAVREVCQVGLLSWYVCSCLLCSCAAGVLPVGCTLAVHSSRGCPTSLPGGLAVAFVCWQLRAGLLSGWQAEAPAAGMPAAPLPLLPPPTFCFANLPGMSC